MEASGRSFYRVENSDMWWKTAVVLEVESGGEVVALRLGCQHLSIKRGSG